MEKSDDESNGYKGEGPDGWDKYNIRSPKTKTKTKTEIETVSWKTKPNSTKVTFSHSVLSFYQNRL